MENKGKTITIKFPDNGMNKLVIGIIAIGLIAAAVFVLGDGFDMSGLGMGVTGSAVASSSSMTIPLSSISQQAKWYEYDSNGVKIRFFAVKAVDGIIKTGFDACDVCWNAKKGYSQEGSYMICNNCGNRYPISGLGAENKKPGGCWPGYLPSSVSGDNLVIKYSGLARGRQMFA